MESIKNFFVDLVEMCIWPFRLWYAKRLTEKEIDAGRKHDEKSIQQSQKGPAATME